MTNWATLHSDLMAPVKTTGAIKSALLHTGLCKFGGARMAHRAKDRVTNQEFPSCHSWERKRGQKLRIKRFSSERKKQKTADSPPFLCQSAYLNVSTLLQGIVLENKCVLYHYESRHTGYVLRPLLEHLVD